MLDDDQPVVARFRAPDFARAAEQLAHHRAAAVARKTVEGLSLRIEAHDRVRREISQPDAASLIDPDRIGARRIARQFPLLPRLACIINPAYLGYASGGDGWYDAVAAASPSDLQTYGVWLANRYTQGNIIWCLGGDQDDSLIMRQWNIVIGMRSVRTTDIITAHALSGQTNADDAYTYWAGMAGFNLNTVYGWPTQGYFPYTLCAQAWKRGMPFLGFEFSYENSQGATQQMLRQQSYGSLLSGACGQLFGNNPVWYFDAPPGRPPSGNWVTASDSEGYASQSYVKALFAAFEWWKLVPKTNTSLVTSDLGSKAGRIYPARASDGSFAMIYVPKGRTVSVVMSALTPGLVRARLYDPRNGKYETVAGSPFPNSSTRDFTTVGERVIVLDAAA